MDRTLPLRAAGNLLGRLFSSPRRQLAGVGLLGACAALACTAPSPSETASSQSSLRGSEQTIRVGQCSLPAPLSNPALAVPVPEDGRPLPPPTESQILTHVELDAVVDVGGDRPGVRSLSAVIARGTDRGALTFHAGISLANRKVNGDQQRAWESVLSTPGTEASTLVIGDETIPISAVILWWETSGVWMLTLKKEGDGVALATTAPKCTFDTKAWAVLFHPECHDALFGPDAGVPSGACAHTPADTFAGLTRPPEDGGADTGTGSSSGGSSSGGSSSGGSSSGGSSSGTTAPDDDKNTSSGGSTSGGGSSSGGQHSGGTWDIGDGDGGLLSGLGQELKNALEKKKQEDSSCAMGRRPAGGGAVWLLVALAGLARRRAARPRPR
jgi:uncharacterized membrane protein YgcG